MLVGVPTQINIISEFLIELFTSVEKLSLFCLTFLIINSSNPGSNIGITPFLRFSIFYLLLSTQITLFPSSEKHVPLTKPT